MLMHSTNGGHSACVPMHSTSGGHSIHMPMHSASGRHSIHVPTHSTTSGHSADRVSSMSECAVGVMGGMESVYCIYCVCHVCCRHQWWNGVCMLYILCVPCVPWAPMMECHAKEPAFQSSVCKSCNVEVCVYINRK